MNYNHGVTFGFLFCLCITFVSSGQDDLKPWEKYGLSQSEWKMIKENGVSVDKIPLLLSAGISIGEYIKKPWKELGLTEGEWIEKRRSGLTAYDIELETKSHHHWESESKDELSPEFSSFSSNKNQLVSFFLPGFQQLRLKEPSRGAIMAGIALASLAGCFIGTVLEERFEVRPLYMVLLPDMFWSFIDFKITIGKMGTEKR